MRDYKLYLDDILQASKKIEQYSKGCSLQKLKKHSLIADAVVRNLEIIGEAAKYIPQNIKDKYPSVEWKKITGLRNILAHTYFAVDLEVLWDIVENKLPSLRKQIARVLKDLS